MLTIIIQPRHSSVWSLCMMLVQDDSSVKKTPTTSRYRYGLGFAHHLQNSYCYVEHRQPEVDWCEVFILLHEKVGPVADVEVAHNDSELGEAEDEVGEVVDGEVALPQLARPGQQPVPVVLVMMGWMPLTSNLVQNHNKGQEEANTKNGERNNLEWAKYDFHLPKQNICCLERGWPVA